MVQLASLGSTTVYTMRDGERTIGRIEAPAGPPMLGQGAETILLRRELGTGN
jgi:hypothetical protein